jgi:hypothetical protein
MLHLFFFSSKNCHHGSGGHLNKGCGWCTNPKSYYTGGVTLGLLSRSIRDADKYPLPRYRLAMGYLSASHIDLTVEHYLVQLLIRKFFLAIAWNPSHIKHLTLQCFTVCTLPQ